MVATSYPRFTADSAAVFLRYLAQAIGHKGIVVHVLAPDDREADASLIDENVFIHRFKYPTFGGSSLAYGSGILPNLRTSRLLYLQVPFFLIAFLISLFMLARRERPDVIHAHWIIPTGFLAVLVGRILRIPVVTTAHGGDAFSLASKLLRYLKCFTLNRSAIWTSNTHATAAAAINAASISNPVIIPMGVDVRLFSSGNRRLHRSHLGEQVWVILFVGRLVEKKGCKVLLEAFSQVAEKYDGKIALWIVGDGDDRESLERLARNLQLSSVVQFLGRQPNAVLPDIYAAADIVVLPSTEDRTGDTEGLGVVLLEAMASGTPIIASQVGGVEEVIDDNMTGWLVRHSNPNLLAETLCDGIYSPHLLTQMSERARNHVVTYDWKMVAHRFIELYRSVST